MKLCTFLLILIHFCNAIENKKCQEYSVNLDELCDMETERCNKGICEHLCKNEVCGINAECVIKSGYATCDCLPDHAGNPHEFCRPNPCEGACGQNATCVLENNEVHCRCFAGMIGDPRDKCWEIGEDICEPNPCGKFSRCIKIPKPGCLCLPEYFGRPPNCREGCAKDSECSSDQYCNWDNFCVPGCSSDERCDSDEYCDSSEHLCKKGCRFEGSCKEKEACNQFTRTCEPGCILNKDCEDFEFCQHSINSCANPCTEDGPLACGSNAICRSFGHSRRARCSCEDGFVPSPGKGCVPTNVTINSFDKKDCSKYCARYSECDLIDGKIECFCPDETSKILNPFKQCTLEYDKVTSEFNFPGFGNECKKAITPECAVEISPSLVAALAG